MVSRLTSILKGKQFLLRQQIFISELVFKVVITERKSVFFFFSRSNKVYINAYLMTDFLESSESSVSAYFPNHEQNRTHCFIFAFR